MDGLTPRWSRRRRMNRGARAQRAPRHAGQFSNRGGLHRPWRERQPNIRMEPRAADGRMARGSFGAFGPHKRRSDDRLLVPNRSPLGDYSGPVASNNRHRYLGCGPRRLAWRTRAAPITILVARLQFQMPDACRHGLNRRSASKWGPSGVGTRLGFSPCSPSFETRPEWRRYMRKPIAAILAGCCPALRWLQPSRPALAVRRRRSREETVSRTARPGDPARRDPYRVARWEFADGCSAVASGEQELDEATSRMVRSHCRRRGRSCRGRRFMQRWLLPGRCRRRSDCRIVVRSRRGCVDRLGGRPGQVRVCGSLIGQSA